MLFNSLQYLLFLPTVFLLYWLVPQRLKVPLLLVASYFFYMSWKPLYGLLIFGLTAGNFWLVPLIKGEDKNKKLWLGIVIAANLFTLAIFKYATFAFDSVKEGFGLLGINWREPHLHIILPLGISFFVFEFIHYAFEVYRGKPLVKSFPQFALFASFFPTQIAGPGSALPHRWPSRLATRRGLRRRLGIRHR